MSKESALQRGIPLNNEMVSGMGKEERAFWDDFLGEAFRVIQEKVSEGETAPYTPPASLQKKYKRAINEHNGEKYCQIKQLQEIFSF